MELVAERVLDMSATTGAAPPELGVAEGVLLPCSARKVPSGCAPSETTTVQ